MITARRHVPARSARLSALLRDFAAVPAPLDRVVNGIQIDSRRVQPGHLFLACNGLQHRGRDFIVDALARGAAAVAYEAEPGEPPLPALSTGGVPQVAVAALAQRAGGIAERFYGEPSRDLFMIGVTGTNGKTSCSHYLAQALHDTQQPCGVIGTVGNGLLGDLHAGTHTTPDAVSLHALLAELRDNGATRVAMEVSSHALDQGRVNAVAFDVAVFTNLTRDHLDYHGDMASYGAAKRKLFQLAGLRHAVINGDDAFGRALLASLPAEVAAVSYGRSDAVATAIPHVRAHAVESHDDGLRMAVTSPWGDGEAELPLLGEFNASNVLAVLATLLAMGFDFHDALRRLGRLQPVTGRMQRFGGGTAPLVVVDYAHTPDALEHALGALRAHTRGRLWCVFGCGGDRDRGKRPLMGAVAARLADCVVVTDDNPRGEDPAHITDEIMRGVGGKADVAVIHDRAAAIAHALAHAAVADVVLIAGKGHETYQQIGTQFLPFSDQAVVQRLLSGGRP